MGSFDAILRYHFSMGHLQSAVFLWQRAGALEKDGLASEAAHDQHRAHVTAAIICSAAFADASLNEFFFETAKGWPRHSKEQTTRAADIWKQQGMPKRPAVLNKYDLALRLFDCQPFDHGTPPYQDAALALNLRNVLTHAQLENEDRSKEHEVTYGTKFDRLPPRGARGYFPDQMLSASCAQWVLESLAKLVLEFYRRVDVDYFSKRYVAILDGSRQLSTSASC